LTEIIVAVRRCNLPMKRLVISSLKWHWSKDFFNRVFILLYGLSVMKLITILDGNTGTLLIIGGVPINNYKTEERRMIGIDNKFELGQKVFSIFKKYNKWIPREKSLEVVCIYYKHKLYGEPDLLYNMPPYGKVREENMFLDYKSALAECKKRNEALNPKRKDKE